MTSRWLRGFPFSYRLGELIKFPTSAWLTSSPLPQYALLITAPMANISVFSFPSITILTFIRSDPNRTYDWKIWFHYFLKPVVWTPPRANCGFSSDLPNLFLNFSLVVPPPGLCSLPYLSGQPQLITQGPTHPLKLSMPLCIPIKVLVTLCLHICLSLALGGSQTGGMNKFTGLDTLFGLLIIKAQVSGKRERKKSSEINEWIDRWINR